MMKNTTAVPVIRYNPSLSEPAAKIGATVYAPAPASHDDEPVIERVGMILVTMYRGELVAIALVQTEGFQRHEGRMSGRKNAQAQFVDPVLTILQRHESVCSSCAKIFPRGKQVLCDGCLLRLKNWKARDAAQSGAGAG